MNDFLKAPFPYFGGKSRVADLIWRRLGDVTHYMEPFFGSGAVLWRRPKWHKRTMETVCDVEPLVANAWRAIKHEPDAVAELCDWPVCHVDLNARRKVINGGRSELYDKMSADENYYDVRLAAYFVWCASCWIGSGLTRPGARPHLTGAGQGVHRTGSRGDYLRTWFSALSKRLRRVREVCGPWERICGGDWQDGHGTCGVFLDPPYSLEAGRDMRCYGPADDVGVAHEVRAWALDRGSRKTYRIALCGYDGEHDELEGKGWAKVSWKATGGYSNHGREGSRGEANCHRERIWFSPHCLVEARLFA